MRKVNEPVEKIDITANFNLNNKEPEIDKNDLKFDF